MADVLELVDDRRFRLLGPRQRPDPRGRPAQLAGLPQLPPQQHPGRGGRRLLAARRRGRRRGAPGRLRGGARRSTRTPIIAALRAAARSGLRAAPRGARERASRAKAPASSRRARCASSRWRSSRRDGTPVQLTREVPADHPAFAGHFPGPAAAARRAAAGRGAGGRAGRAGAGGAARRAAHARGRQVPGAGAARAARCASTSAPRAAPRAACASRCAAATWSRPAGAGRRRSARMSCATAAPEAGDAKSRQADWSRTPERSNMLALRVICWIAHRAAAAASRALVLHPISALLPAVLARRRGATSSATCSAPSARTPAGATATGCCTPLPPRCSTASTSCAAAWTCSTCACTATSRSRPRLTQGRGAFLLGAHIGSFEAMGACKHQSGRPRTCALAMLMYPDNAQQITAVLDAIACPACGRTSSRWAGRIRCWTLRDWLDGGGLAGLLADRTLPGPKKRASSAATASSCRSSASRRCFNDGPFRLAALLRRKVFFMAGLYAGGARYDVRFEPLADFSERAGRSGRAGTPHPRRARSLCRAARGAVPRATRTTGSTSMTSGSKIRA